MAIPAVTPVKGGAGASSLCTRAFLLMAIDRSTSVFRSRRVAFRAREATSLFFMAATRSARFIEAVEIKSASTKSRGEIRNEASGTYKVSRATEPVNRFRLEKALCKSVSACNNSFFNIPASRRLWMASISMIFPKVKRTLSLSASCRIFS